jgi:hypothetical protein
MPGRIVGYAAGMIPAVNILPQAGGLFDQSAWLMGCFDMLDGMRLKAMAEV